MNITEVKIRLLKKETDKVKATASVSIDNAIVIHDIKIIESNNNLFIAMPNRRTSTGAYIDIAHPLNSQTRKLLNDVIIQQYLNTINN